MSPPLKVDYSSELKRSYETLRSSDRSTQINPNSDSRGHPTLIQKAEAKADENSLRIGICFHQ
jgi:hypothetical protein